MYAAAKQDVPFADTLSISRYVKRRLDQYASTLKRGVLLQDLTTEPLHPLAGIEGVCGWTLEELDSAIQQRYGVSLHPGHWG